MARATNRRDLSLLRESAATTRVLDLAAIEEQYGSTEEYLKKPLFRNYHLNTSIITKHALRANERMIFNGLRTTATKIMFPFSKTDLSLGADSIFVGEAGFEKLLQQKIHAESKAELEADVDLLRLIDELPSFDPFLMRERLRQSGIEPARCYFDVSDADAARMQKFVGSQITQLVELAFANQSQTPRELSARLAEKLMTDENAASLEPLRATLRLTGDEYREGMFAWKGFLYYKWVVGELAPKLGDLARSILAAKVVHASRDDLEAMGSSRRKIVAVLGSTIKLVQESLSDYDRAFESLAQGKPNAFRDFLLSAPNSFLVIGEAVGIVKHVESFWRFRFPVGRSTVIESEEALEIFQDFEITLGGIEVAQKLARDGLTFR